MRQTISTFAMAIGGRGETPANRTIRAASSILVAFALVWALVARTHALTSGTKAKIAQRFPSVHDMMKMTDAEYAAICRADGYCPPSPLYWRERLSGRH